MNTKSIVVVATMLLGTACAGTMDRRTATVPIVSASEETAATELRVTHRGTGLAVSGAERVYNCQHNTLAKGHGIASFVDGSLLVVRYETTADGSVNVTARRVDADGGLAWTRRFDGVAISDDPGFDLSLGLDGHRIADERILATR